MDAKYLKTKYLNKKRNATSCGTDLTITEDEFIHMFNVHEGTCDYTGLPTSLENPNSPEYITLERIDANIGYAVGNVCLIRNDVNSLKGAVLDHGEDDKNKCTFKDRGLLLKIVETLYNPVKMDDIRKKYGHPVQNITQQTLEKNMTKVSDCPTKDDVPHVLDTNPEMLIAKEFIAFNDFVNDKLSLEFNMTFSQFSRALNKKVCQLTKRELTPQTARLFVLDKTLPVTKDNVLTVQNKVRNNLDTFLVRSELSFPELKNLCKVLMK